MYIHLLHATSDNSNAVVVNIDIRCALILLQSTCYKQRCDSCDSSRMSLSPFYSCPKKKKKKKKLVYCAYFHKICIHVCFEQRTVRRSRNRCLLLDSHASPLSQTQRDSDAHTLDKNLQTHSNLHLRKKRTPHQVLVATDASRHRQGLCRVQH
jgi:hypothetical protein